MPTDRVVELTRDDLVIPFDGDPYLSKDGYRIYKIDTTPAYMHDASLVKKRLKLVEAAVKGKIVCKPTIYILPYETAGRTNGWAETRERYPKDEKHPWDGQICLIGKRIPLHPAMTRYLVSHEYGHHIEYEFLRRAGQRPGYDILKEEYSKVRKIEAPKYYGPGTWHVSIGEVFANDFRIIVTETEEEFWPHPYPHPLKSKQVQKWWEENL